MTIDPLLPANGCFSVAHLAMGGPVEKLLRQAAESGAVCLATPQDFWNWCQTDQPSTSVVARDRVVDLHLREVEIVSQEPLVRSELFGWRSLASASMTVRFRVDSDLRLPTLYEWSREVFPESLLESGELVWRSEFQNYERQIGETFGSLNGLRYWPGFLGAKKLPFAATAAREWAFAQVRFSPQNDRQESGDLATLNPTLEVIPQTMQAVWRIDGALKSRRLNWQEAAIIDELRETPRVPSAALISELTLKKFPFKEPANFASVVQGLTFEGLILMR